MYRWRNLLVPGERYNLEQGISQKSDPESKNSYNSQVRENFSTPNICIRSIFETKVLLENVWNYEQIILKAKLLTGEAGSERLR